MKKIVLISVMSLVLFLTGCGSGGGIKRVVFTTGFHDDEVFRIEDRVCSLSEVMVYLINTQNGYEASFGKQLWEAQTDDGTVEDRLKESVLAKVAQLKVMNLLAQENGIALEEEELQKAGEAAQVYYSSLSAEEITAMNGVTLEEITDIYAEQVLANKLYDYIIRDINPEVSDDEARIITVEQIVIPYDNENRAIDRARQAQSLILEGNSFDDVMTMYNESDEGTVSFGKGEKEKVFEETAFNLGNEEVSGIIETSEGYVILKCISTFNREETEENKVKIVEQRKREVFGAQYDAFVSTLTKELNTDVWEGISLVDDENVTTSSLMEVYQEYFG